MYHFSCLPIDLPFPEGDIHITSIIQHKQSLIASIFPNIICKYDIIITNDNIMKCKKSKFIKLKLSNATIKDVKSFNDSLLIQLDTGKKKDALIMFPDDEKKSLSKIEKCLDFFTINQFSDFAGIGIVDEKKISVLKFSNGNFQKIFFKELDDNCLSLSLTYPLLFCLTENTMNVIDIKENSVITIIGINSNIQESFPLSNHSFFHSNGISALIVESNLRSNVPPIIFDKKVKAHAYNGKLFASIDDNKIYLYDFEKYNESVVFVGVNKVCSFDNNFIVASKTELRLIIDVSVIINEIFLKPDSVSSNFIILQSIFEQFWNKGEKEKAIMLFKIPGFKDNLNESLSMFPFFVYFQPTKIQVPKLNDVSSNNKEYLLKVLFELKASHSINDIELLDTGIAELITSLKNINAFISFIKTNSKINEESMKMFFEKSKNDIYPIYLREICKFDEAISYFQNQNNIDEVIKTLLICASDFLYIKKYFPWIISKSPIKACKIFACNKISTTEIIKYIQEVYPRMYLRVLFYLISRDDIFNRELLINEFLTKMIEIMNELSNGIFNLKNISFCECVIKEKNPPLNIVINEVNEFFIEFIKKYNDIIDNSILQNLAYKIPSANVKIEIFKLIHQYNQALELIWNEKGSEECESYCKTEQSSELFYTYMQLLKYKLQSKEYINKVISLLNDNFSVIDIEKTFSLIDPTIPIEDVSTLLEKSYMTINSKRMNKEILASLSSSNNFDILYEKTKKEIKCVELRADTICSCCGLPLGYHFVQCTPNGKFYHYVCLQNTK